MPPLIDPFTPQASHAEGTAGVAARQLELPHLQRSSIALDAR
jgi:hypothetical protein